MLRIPYNGEPCEACGHSVLDLVVNELLTDNSRFFSVNRTLPCSCVHAVVEVDLRTSRAVKQPAKIHA